MFDSENAENIQKFNEFTGMAHRSAPYDLTKPEDLAQAFLVTTAACMDYRRYHRELVGIEEQMDESLECYDTATWINMSVAPEKTDKLAAKAIGSLRKTTDLFHELTERGDRNCVMILKAILSAPEAVQAAVWGKAYPIPEKQAGAKIEELFEALDEADLHYEMHKNRDEFLKLMEETWESSGPEL